MGHLIKWETSKGCPHTKSSPYRLGHASLNPPSPPSLLIEIILPLSIATTANNHANLNGWNTRSPRKPTDDALAPSLPRIDLNMLHFNPTIAPPSPLLPSPSSPPHLLARGVIFSPSSRLSSFAVPPVLDHPHHYRRVSPNKMQPSRHLITWSNRMSIIRVACLQARHFINVKR